MKKETVILYVAIALVVGFVGGVTVGHMEDGWGISLAVVDTPSANGIGRSDSAGTK